jgi:hypothetical protein
MDAGTNTIQRFKNKMTENEQETVYRGEGGMLVPCVRKRAIPKNVVLPKMVTRKPS